MKPKNKTFDVILKAAYTCLSTYGYANVSMRDIAKTAKVPLSQLTYHFKTKENLFLEVINLMISEYQEKFREEISEGVEKDHLRHIVNSFKEILQKEPEVLKLLIDFSAQSLWNESFRDKITDFFRGTIQSINENNELIDTESGQTNKDDSYKLASLSFFSLYGTAFNLLLDNQSFDIDQLDFIYDRLQHFT